MILRKVFATSRLLFNNYLINYKNLKTNFSNEKSAVILGIETSCDDTGIAIVDSSKNILGQALSSQLLYHLQEGGINPIEAHKLHEQNIQSVFDECVNSVNFDMKNIDAIAVTVGPGLPGSLVIGRDFAVKMSKEFNKPLIPIHHMKAHALTIRMVDQVDFPFLVLLVSGGHCILGLAQSVDEFKILGQTRDNAPGEALDKVARRLRLINDPAYSKVCGGQAIELAAKKADNPTQFFFPHALAHDRDCHFSFSGLTTKANMHITQHENKFKISGAEIMPDANNLCAGVLMAFTKHICIRTQRAMEFIDKKDLIPKEQRTLVVSGGVASNNFIANGLKKVCDEFEFKFARPPPKLCTDNGIMIAWNGIEKYKANAGVITQKDEIIDIFHKKPIGEDWSDIVKKEDIIRKRLKFKYQDLLDT